MACGSCGKKNQSTYIVQQPQFGQGSKSQPQGPGRPPVRTYINQQSHQTRPASPVVRPLAQTQVPAVKPMMHEHVDRCPVCKMILKRVSRIGQGDLLQCTNQQCGYLKKV